ncbi:ROK family protein [Actinopolymorpha sp. B11F2]|uniref:ROK family protein n=1 Tax=Actinopolymorpha sp. B11F2 TaxID=3160862 RepID=UPI0032E3C329
MTDAPTRLLGRADQGAVRRANLAVVVRALRSSPRTRAQLTADTLLTKATVSSLVGELSTRGLVRSHEPTKAGLVGRPGQQVELIGERVLAVGLELNVDYLAAVVLDLTGERRAKARTALDVSASVEDTVDAAADLIARVTAQAETAGNVLAGVGVAAPGLVDAASGQVRVAPNLGWRDVALRDLLRRRLPRTRVMVDNEANLATLAEYAAVQDVAATDRDLIYLTGGIGIGGGIVVNGEVVRGSAGYAGEVGHLAVAPAPDGERCGCGRRGCLETVCGLGALLRLAADEADPVHDHGRDLDERLDLLMSRATAGDPRTLRAFAQIGRALGHGASMLVNLVNPRVLVLGGYFARVGEFLREPVEAELAERVVAPDLGGCRITLSRLGLAAAATGAAHSALQPVLDDPTLVPALSPRHGAHATLEKEIG